MNKISNTPRYSRVYDISDYTPQKESLYICKISEEERSQHFKGWEDEGIIRVVAITEIDDSTYTSIEEGNEITRNIKSYKGLDGLIKASSDQYIYIDITGLPHHFWAILVKYCIDRGLKFIVIYVEPKMYKYNTLSVGDDIFDLSEKREGLGYLPGFANFSNDEFDDFVFVPMLGFETERMPYMIESVQPMDSNIHPIIGVPGYRIEYPFHTYLCNSKSLIDNRCWTNSRLSHAACPFDVYWDLLEISSLPSAKLMKIAPIGTKPHALGAIIFALLSPVDVEILYDFPIRTHGRTKEADKLWEYLVSDFVMNIKAWSDDQ